MSYIAVINQKPTRRRHTVQPRRTRAKQQHNVHLRGKWLLALRREFGKDVVAGGLFEPSGAWTFKAWCAAREVEGLE